MSGSTPALWSNDEIEAHDDGFLWVKDGRTSDEQPLLLHSTEELLRTFYPSSSRESILLRQGYQAKGDPVLDVNRELDSMDRHDSKDTKDSQESDPVEADGEGPMEGDCNEEKVQQGKKSKIPSEYEIYQGLTRHDNLAGRIQAALLDIQYFRHRCRRKKSDERVSRDQAKLRALAHQQQRLLSQNAESTEESGDEDGERVEGDKNEEEEDGEEEEIWESQTVRLARSINSMRALFPHLLPILNHPRRNDKNLVIGKARWKSKKKAMCWILGTEIFDTTTCKVCINAHKDAINILEGFIPTHDAQRICSDPLGSPRFWSKSQWIQGIEEKASPEILDPLTILAGGDLDRNMIRSVARQCDEQFHENNAKFNTPEIQNRYNKAVDKLHLRLAKILTNRFPKARVSIYGSCLSNLSLGKGADVDLSLWIPEADQLRTAFQIGQIEANLYEKDMKRLVYQAYHKLRNLQQEFRGMQAITRARVPVIKGTYTFANNPYSPDGSIK